MSHLIIARFESSESVKTDPVYQWNYGQVLRIQGINLPSAVEVHFSIPTSPEAKIRIGTTKDNVTDVVIPDTMLEQEETVSAYVYLTDEDSGTTTYTIRVPIKSRAKPEAFDPPETKDIFEQALAQLCTDLDELHRVESEVDQDAQHALDCKNRSEEAMKSAEDSAKYAEDIANQISEDINTIKPIVDEAIEVGKEIAKSKEELDKIVQDTASYKDEAKRYADDAKSSSESASEYASNASSSATSASESASQSQSSASSAKESAEASKKSAEDSSSSATQSKESAEDANQAKLDAENAKSAAESIRDEVAAATVRQPYPNPDTDTWWVWDIDNSSYIDTGISSKGTPGSDGEDGTDGVGIQDIVYTGEDEQGGRVYKILMTDSTEYSITAPKGRDGEDGQDGHTPEKGIDYYTEDDKAELLETLRREVKGVDFHICTSDEYDAESGIPTISDPTENVFYLVPSGEEAPNLFVEWFYKDGWERLGSATIDLSNVVKDVQINGGSVVTDGIVNLPLTSASNYGLSKLSYGNGIWVTQAGVLATTKASNSNIDDRSSDYFVIVPKNIDYAVKAAMCDGKGEAWTTDEQTAARGRIGIVEHKVVRL